MKPTAFLPFALTLIAPALGAQPLELPRASPRASVSQTIGLTDITVKYSRPSVKERVIFGGLVPWDAVWRLGANEATTFETSTDITVEGQKLAAGVYSLHAIPGRNEWTMIFNSQSNQWGSFQYDAAKDALRVKVMPTAGTLQETMLFSFPDVGANNAHLLLAWDSVRISLAIASDTSALAIKRAKDAMESLDDWRLPFRAADYAFSNNVEKELAMQWVDRSIAMRATFANLKLKAAMLAKDGKTKDAIATAEKAIKAGKANNLDAGELAGAQKMIDEWKKPAKK